MRKSSDADCFFEFAKYSSLNVLGMLGLSCYILADTYFISRGIGADGLTALNLAIPVYSFIHGCGLMIGMGAGTRYSLYKSLDHSKETDRLFTNAVLLALSASLLFLMTGIFFTGKIVTLLGADVHVYQMTKTYLKVILLFSPLFLMNNVILCFVRNDGAPQLAMRAMLSGSLSNIVLDYIFIFPCNMGITGAVLATGMAPLVSLLILSAHFFKKKNQFHFIPCRLTFQRISGIVISGVPSLVTEVSSGIVMMIFNAVILNLEGNTGVAAYGVIANISLVVISIYTGISQGIQPVISRHYGMGNRRSALAVLKYAVVSMLLFSALIYAGIFLYAEQLSSIFNKDQNELLQLIAVKGLRIYFTSCAPAGFNIIISAYFTSCAHPVPANLISMLRGFVIIIPLAFLLPATAGMTGVWCALPCTEFAVSIVGIAFYRTYGLSG